MSSTAVYPITQALVLAQNPDTQSLTVMLRDGQGLSQPVPVMIPGPCDGLRIKQSAMPGRGTMGIVAFLNNDIRSGVWLGAIPTVMADAISNPTGDPFLNYESHFSGYWHSLDQSGSENTRWPDGSMLIVGSGFTPTRHIQNSAGQRESVPVADSDRPATISPMPITLKHSSGTTVEIDSSGNVTVAASGTILASSPTSIEAKAPVVKIDNGGTTQYLVTATAWTWLTTHTHSGVQTGAGNTGTPNSVPTSGVLSSILQAQ